VGRVHFGRGSTALLALGATLFAAGLLEGLLRVTGVDERVLRAGLYYQGADLEVHQCSVDPFLHYELKPRSSFSGRGVNGEPYAVDIDEYGARRPGHPAAKPPGTFRILCFGGSTMYGAHVNDDETIPAALEARLNRLSPDERAPWGRYEVWNFGTSAYTLGQAAHLARTRLAAFDADLVIVQLHNVGRRPYLASQWCSSVDAERDADGGRGFFLEQFPVRGSIAPAWHVALAHHSAIYRTIMALGVSRGDGSPCEYCEELSRREARLLVQEATARAVPVLFVAIPADRGWMRAEADVGVSAAMFIDLHRPGREPDFYEVHPSAATLGEFASLLVDDIRARGLLSYRAGDDR
jgi:hypothetical protein